LFTWDSDLTSNGAGAFAAVSGSSNDDGTDVYFGAGLTYDVTETLGVKAEWTRYNIDGDDEYFDTDVDFISAGLVFKFGKLL